jgi:hypothetical protein
VRAGGDSMRRMDEVVVADSAADGYNEGIAERTDDH